jgi:ABC-type uncharacterized transport system permease subunit
MRNVSMVLIGLSALGFLLALFTALTNSWIMGVGPEGFSRSCSNLALISIALAVCFRAGNKYK